MTNNDGVLDFTAKNEDNEYLVDTSVLWERVQDSNLPALRKGYIELLKQRAMEDDLLAVSLYFQLDKSERED